MLKFDLIDQIFVGLVEDNIDPYRLGRIKVRVQAMYGDIPLEDIPYATPFKSVDGRRFEIPAIGKVVSVVFDNGNIYMPVYHYAECYNINLQKKLDSLDDKSYSNFQAFTYDHRTQNFIDNDGYRLDYYYNQLHIDDESINIRLKDNTNRLTLGSKDANQEAVLGTNFFEWFDKLIDKLSIPTSLIDGTGAPIVRPDIDELIQTYRKDRASYLSMHVKITDNNSIEKVKRSVETIVETNDSELTINKQNPFELNNPNTTNSNLMSEDVKQTIVNKNSEEQDKLNSAQPSSMISSEQRDYHDGYGSEENPIPTAKQKDDNGNITPMSFNDMRTEKSTFKSDAQSSTKTTNPTDTYNENQVVDDKNYGLYTTSSVPSNTSSSNFKSNIQTPSGVMVVDKDGNSVEDTVEIWVDGKVVGTEPYVIVQGKKVVKKYYEPLMQMIEAAKKDGVLVTLSEAYRVWDEQMFLRKKGNMDVVENGVVKHKKQPFTVPEYETNSSMNYYPYTGRPGWTIHMRGAAFDFNVGWGRHKVYTWMVQNAAKFGFIRTIQSEVWHWEYLPWTYNNKNKSKDTYAYIPKTDASWMGISVNIT